MINKISIMKTTLGVAALAATLISAVASVDAAEKSHWGYGVENGPDAWSTISSEFSTCATGKHQSPIDIPSSTSAGKSEISFDYKSGAASAVNNGHSIQINVADGNSMTINGEAYKLLQFHFHTPSENTVDGLHYPMEAHLVHKSEKGKLAVVSVMVRTGAKGMLDDLPKPVSHGDTTDITNVDASGILPGEKGYRIFTGSLTTPPCSEGVTWIVMKEPVQASTSAISRFYTILGANNRPTHPLNGRNIMATN